MAMSTGIKRLLQVCVLLVWSGAMVIVGVVGIGNAEEVTLPFGLGKPVAEPDRFYPLDKLVISLPGERYPRYLLLEMALQSPSEEIESKLLASDPLLKNTMIKLMGNKSLDELNSTENMEKLQEEARGALQNVLRSHGFEIQLDAVLFTRLVVQ
ncbi:flagellar basal body-associated FliL family protein [Ferrimonas sediminicola]|uniref:Flagellar protein FliL n=1 Tax=Ferrimonas sediminicola TaxID=2569538 RepID=A0A4V6WMM5_9GAMM|nr:flagellar basal body-associated FliL family protein [Ferrimonas sediminicola]TKB47808.1 flagellar basal body-associated FliL family protein [Ferrimonas sediminicola]